MRDPTFIPLMSATATQTILATLLRRCVPPKEHWIVEYGSGHSTKFFVDQLVKEGVSAHYVAVERSPEWFRSMSAQFPGGKLAKHLWTWGDYAAFLRAESQNMWSVPEQCRRLRREQKKMASVRSIAQFFFRRNQYWFDASYRAMLHTVDFEYAYIFEGFKDQYGESPHKHRYIELPLTTLLQALKAEKDCHTVFIIDGGPRADIVKEIFGLIDAYKNLTVDIFLLEAYRGYYQPILSSRSGGTFIAAEKNEMLDGREYLEEPKAAKRLGSRCAELFDVPTIRDALQKELWHFTNSLD